MNNFPLVLIEEFVNAIRGRELDEKISLLNQARRLLHNVSPFSAEPVDLVVWTKADSVVGNSYNPNSVAPPEMALLEHSITADGYTQPIVSWEDGTGYEVVDGFHRHRVGRESEAVRARIHGYLPLVVINSERVDKSDRMAATIRHNRARGKHQVDAMSDIVVELKRRNWSHEKIGRELGMDADEVLRLTQIAGLAEVFADQEFNEAWEHDGPAEEEPATEDGEPVNLEWMNTVELSKHEPGWADRTEQSSVLYGDNGHQLGLVQKSRFKADEWFYYVYTAPIIEGRESSLDAAKRQVETLHSANS